MAERVAPPDGRTIPPVGAELLLTLGRCQAYAVPHGHHGVGRRPAHVPLAGGQSWDTAADGVRPQRHHRRLHPVGTARSYSQIKLSTVLE